MTVPAISIDRLSKTYASGFRALDEVSLDVRPGEIFALLGPNGAGKTTLISIVCGIAVASSGRVTVAGYDIAREYRQARREIGLVPQELTVDPFHTVLGTVTYTRGLFGRPRDPALIERILRDLSLWEKRDSKIVALSGGMKRRVMIAKALSHEPKVLFLDEPTAGVDVELRRDMWKLVGRLREAGTAIVLTTHYIEEAEEMADRIGVIRGGRLLLVEDKASLIAKLGRSQLILRLATPIDVVPDALAAFAPERSEDGSSLIFTYQAGQEGDIAEIIRRADALSLGIRGLETRQSSLEEIFVGLVHEPARETEV